jgi:hypothetical protein
MYQECSVCGLKYEREQGYFLGAMYISYGIGCVFLVAFCLPFWLWTPLTYYWGLLAGSLLLVPLLPAIFRYSRTLWLYMDHGIDPAD